ncbi:PAQR family membrane homeostasis protein TrhA [Aureispira anguillae]|uniref:Hemolysin III family protein n=1 Tax=Aureispira anguillae TaxID=2864201 RepID=A0A915YFQ0_9BACT|nr:hemolysin III family protein [Aureispira anguillae]BDS12302.1 hemolysin III family protein [Aureispira anguillae]
MDKLKELNDWESNDISNRLETELGGFFSDLPIRTYREELLNTWSHGLFAMVSVIGFIYLIYLGTNSNEEYALTSAIVYGLSLVILFTASALYHGSSAPLLKKRLRIMDHCAIFLFIAGNYTPLLLLTVGGTTGWSLLLLQWSVAMVGVLLKIKFTGQYDWFFILLFVVMAWIGVIQGDYIYNTLPATGFNWLIVGGLVYMFGIFFYKSEGRVPYAHLIWHLFVMGGCFIHYLVMINYVF